MKTAFIVIAIALGWSSVGRAAPVYYTFTGEITSVEDSAGVVAGTYGTVDIGELPSVEYTFLVDFEQPGTYVALDGTTVVVPDGSNSMFSYDRFYTDLISGSLIEGPEYITPSTNVAEYNWGQQWDFVTGPDRAFLFGDSESNYTTVYSLTTLFTDWVVDTTMNAGTELTGFEWAYNTAGDLSILESSLRLTSVSDTPAPVPGPATAWLFVMGLVGLLGYNKRRKRS